eukprot:90135-Rhodomonas_salina.1
MSKTLVKGQNRLVKSHNQWAKVKFRSKVNSSKATTTGQKSIFTPKSTSQKSQPMAKVKFHSKVNSSKVTTTWQKSNFAQKSTGQKSNFDPKA